jgi:hypothetical protein
MPVLHPVFTKRTSDFDKIQDACPESPSYYKKPLWERLPAAKLNDLPPPESHNQYNVFLPDNRKIQLPQSMPMQPHH